jgi:ribosome maturation factor RimP
MIDQRKIERLVEEKFAESDRFLVEVLIRPGNRIWVFIDSDTGITIDDCVEVSRHIEANVDRETEDYELQVSSSGLDQPLKILRQFTKNIGKAVEVILADGEKLTAMLLKADDQGIQLLLKGTKKEPGDKTITLEFNEIKETKIKIIF